MIQKTRFTTQLVGFAALIAAFTAARAEITQIDDDLYVAGQPEAAEITEFAGRGGLHVINLRPPSETPGFNEAAVVTGAGMAYYNIPVDGAAGLTRRNVTLLDELLSRLDGERTLLHCSSSNRVGALMALRAKWLHGANREEALAVGARHGLNSMRPAVERLLQSD